jgi:glycerate 2-kinase
MRSSGEAPIPVPPPPDHERLLRDDTHRILHAALRAVEPARLVRDHLREHPPAAESAEGLVLLAVGKAAPGMTAGAVTALGTKRIRRGLVIAPESALEAHGGGPSGLPPALDVLPGGHPLPTEDGLRAARRARELVAGLGTGESLLLLLSGGASALLTLPARAIPLAELRQVTRRLLEAGAPIHELNAVRKHAEQLKGGRVAVLAGGRHVTALAISDVVGDRPDVIGSGPVSPDPSTWQDALQVLRRHEVREGDCPNLARHLEDGAAGRLRDTPRPDDPAFAQVDYRIVGHVGLALQGAARYAERMGYAVSILGASVEGEARTVGRRLGALARSLQPGPEEPGSGGSADPRWHCILSGGETTVTVRGPGHGGPNQEVALAAALVLDGVTGRLVASLGTDGQDGPTPAAGGLATGSTLARARGSGLDAVAALARNDSYPLLETLGDLLITGPTGTNVMDVHLVLAHRG